jgi:hypothetical protein
MGNVEGLAGPGAMLELDVGYRILPHLAIGAYGTFSSYQRGDIVPGATDVRGASAGLQATVHFLPRRAVDPWVSFGGGWKGLWLDPPDGKSTTFHGLELARIQIGIDYRLSRNVAVSPMIGGSLGRFFVEDSPMSDGSRDIKEREMHVTGFAGVGGRFDLGGG